MKENLDILALRENRGIKQRSGEFRNAYNLDKVITAPLRLVTSIMYCVCVFLVEGGEMLDDIAKSMGMELTLSFVGFVYLLFVVVIICTVVLSVYSAGRRYRWKTTDEALILTCGPKTMYYYYSEIEDIRYEKYGLFWGRGWDVRIKTELREDRYLLIIGNSRLYRDFKETPFYILMQNIGFAEPDGVDIHSGELPQWVTFEKFRENIDDNESRIDID